MSTIVNNKDHLRANIAQEKNAGNAKSSQFELIFSESKKLIKQGYYKKAYVMIQQHMRDPKNIDSVDKMRLYKRIMSANVRICSKLLNKPENPNRYDKLQRLLDAGSHYLNQWQTAISIYVVKTDKKFVHLHGLLEEVSNFSSDDSRHQILNDSQSRRSSHRDSTNLQTPLLGSPLRRNSRYDKQVSIFAHMLKNQENREASSENILNNSFNDVEGSNVVIEEFTGTEINPQHQMDEFFRCCIRHLMNYGLFYRKFRLYKFSFRYLDYCYNLTKTVENTLNPSLLHTCARAKIPYGTLQLELKRYKEALEIFESALNTFQIELSIRFNKHNQNRNDDNFVKKLRKTAKLICITLLNIAKCNELQLQYSRTLESYKLAAWFSRHFLRPDDEFVKFVFKAYNKAREHVNCSYGTHLEEVAEMERVVFENNEIVISADPKEEAENKSHFHKLQEQLYKKFCYSELNKRRIPVKLFQSPVFAKRTANDELFGAKSEGQEDFFEKTVDVTRNPIRELLNSAAFGGSPAMDNQNNHDIKILEDAGRKREKKLPKKPAGKPTSEGKKRAINERFMDAEKEKNTMEITADEAKKCIQQLNRNIKMKRPKIATSMSFSSGLLKSSTIETSKYVDIDQYLEDHVENAINTLEEEKSKPQDFSQVIKNHIYHSKREVFDKNEFQHRRRTLGYLKFEDLGDEKMNFKELVFGGLNRERRAVETEGFFITTQTQVKNEIQTRIDASKSLSIHTSPKSIRGRKPMKPFMFESPIHRKRFLRLSEQESPKPDENKNKKKVSLASLIWKHKEKLGLKKIVQVLKEMQKRSKNENFLKGGQQNLQDAESKPEIIEEPPFDPKAWDKIGVMVKERLTKMMEDVEYEIKDDDGICNRILANKQIFQEKKPKRTLLKGMDELASSCKYLSTKKEASMKTLDFVNLVRLKMKIPDDKNKAIKKTNTKTETEMSTQESKPKISKITFKHLFL